jgi:hypothetical protein
MKSLFKILLTACILGFVLGFSGLGNDVFVGFCRAMGAVFFILAFITKLIQKAEVEEMTTVKVTSERK